MRVVEAVEVDATGLGGFRGSALSLAGGRLRAFLGFGLDRLVRGALLLVALLGQRRRGVLGQGDDIDGVGLAHVGVRQVEPLLDRAGVGRGEEVEVLAGGVEDRLARLAQAVGDGDTSVSCSSE